MPGITIPRVPALNIPANYAASYALLRAECVNDLRQKK